MRSPEEVPVHHLILDTGGFLKCPSLVDVAAKFYTLQGVLDEVRDLRARDKLKSLPFELIIREPTLESIKKVVEVSKKTGDYASLSAVDIKVIALAHDIHIEECGPEGVVYDVKPKPPIWETSGPKKKVQSEAPVDDTNSDDVTEKLDAISTGEGDAKPVGPAEADDADESSDEESEGSENEETTKTKTGMDEWVDEGNIDEVVSRMESVVDENTKKMKVACMTVDFACQNVLLHMHLNIAAVDGLKITRLRSYALRCRICKEITTVVTKRFCAKCGYESLHKVGISVDRFGVQRIHVNWERERVKRGYKFSLPAPKGGKHGFDLQVTEDHRLAQNRMAKFHQDPVSENPFAVIDVTSRAALLGLRDYDRKIPRNPNAVKGGWKKKNFGKKK